MTGRFGVRRIHIDREFLEQQVACGVPNSHLMVQFGLTYPQLREFIDAMDDTTVVDGTAGRGGLKPHGTRAAVRRHQRRAEPLCDRCTQAEQDRATAYRALRGTSKDRRSA